MTIDLIDYEVELLLEALPYLESAKKHNIKIHTIPCRFGNEISSKEITKSTIDISRLKKLKKKLKAAKV